MEAKAAAPMERAAAGSKQQQPLKQHSSRFHLARDGREQASSSLIEVGPTSTTKLAAGDADQQQLEQPPVVAATTKPTTKAATTTRATRVAETAAAATTTQSINYWHYKQTGIKSRPIKLLKHPIEHIERKIIITYLLGFLFKLIAIVTGPVIVLAVYSMTVPFMLLRRSTWWLLNLSCTFDARIKTTHLDSDGGGGKNLGDHCDDTDSGVDDDDHGNASATADRRPRAASQRAAALAKTEEQRSKLANQVHWNYCPLSYIEAYWFKERLVNNVILVVNGGQVSVEKLRCLMRASILSKSSFRKFLSRVVARGIPFYKGYYWHHLGLSERCDAGDCGCEKLGELRLSPATPANRNDRQATGTEGQQEWRSSELALGSLSAVEDRFSVASNDSASTCASTTTTATDDYDAVRIAIPAPAANSQADVGRASTTNKDASSKDFKDTARTREGGVCLSKHIYLDESLDSSDVTSASIRRHAYRLLGTGLDMTRPLWEIRLIKPKNNRSKSYLIFRCHQSLADGRSLIKILTDHLTELPMGGEQQQPGKRRVASPSCSRSTSRVATADSLPFIDSGGGDDDKWQELKPDNSDPDEDDDDDDDNKPEARETRQANNNEHQSATNEKAHANGRSSENNFDGSKTEASKRADSRRPNLKLLQFEREKLERERDEEELELKPIREKRSFISRVSKVNSWRSAIFVGPLTVLLWVIWTFTRRENNHLNKCLSVDQLGSKGTAGEDCLHSLTSGAESQTRINKLARALKTKQQQTHNNNEANKNSGRPVFVGQGHFDDPRRFYMNQYSLTKFYRIKQMTRSTVSDVILCGLSGALRDYLRKFNGISNPPNLNISLIVDMRQPEHPAATTTTETSRSGNSLGQQQQRLKVAGDSRQNPVACNDQGDDDDNHCSNKNLAQTLASQQQQQGDDNLTLPMPPPPQVNCTLVNVPLPTSVEGTVPRLWELRNTMDELRASADPWVMLGLQRILFTVLPSSWYQRIINYIALRNSSTFVSNIRGPKNMVESWCVDLLQRAIFEAQQPPQAYRLQSLDSDDHGDHHDGNDCDCNALFSPPQVGQSASKPFEAFVSNSNGNCSASVAKRRAQRLKAKQRRKSQLKFSDGLGSISAIYYCMQPPTGDIPISFNCITYHDRLYVTALSRSLLVEDSKLLIRLFFKQLNQLADTIAKRKSLVTIIRTPVPIEISCQPASPLAEGSGKFQVVEDNAEEADKAEEDEDEDDHEFIAVSKQAQAQEVLTLVGGYQADHLQRHHRDLLASERQVNTPPPPGQGTISPSSSTSSSQLQQPAQTPITPQHQQSSGTMRAGVHKDDIEANFGIIERTNRCQACRQTVCACRRRKSLFSFDSKQRAVNLLSLLHPNFVALRTSRSNESQVELAAQQQKQNTIECLCGQQLLEELDEENPVNLCDGDTREASSAGSRTPSDDGGRLRCLSAKPCCAKCRLISGRSTLSLDATTSSVDIDQQQQRRKHWLGNSNSYQQEHNLDYPNASIAKQKGAQHASAQLIVPQDDRFQAKAHSKSETDLLPATMNVKDDRQGGSKESWFMIGRRSYRKLSMLSRSSNQRQQSTFRNSTSHGGSNNAIVAATTSSRKRNLVDTPIELGRINRRSMCDQSKRRQSVATSTGVLYTNRSVVVKDETNANVSLRYQLDTPFLGIRDRRFSTIGSAVVGNQRRSSLIPFGLMHNQSFPKLFWEDGEAHL